MKLQFKHQKFQADAAKAVVDVFAGQPYLTPTYMMDRGLEDGEQQAIATMDDFTGWRNERIVPELSDRMILEHLQKVQRTNQIKPSDKLEGRYNLTIEMETGVGKTYTYIKTMYELNKHYGWSKFIVVVPSIAIREGVYKSFQVTQEHFAEEYGKKIRFFIYNSAQLTEIDRFASDSAINVMIINSQAFNAKGKDARRIYMKLDEFRSRRPIDIIAKTNPILIIDEPQSVEGKQTKERLKEFNPLLTLRYSATHKADSIYNMVYRLDAMEAYNKRLVKKIAVKGITESGSTATEGFVYLESINLSKADPTATIQFDYIGAKGLRKKTATVGIGYNLYDNSGESGKLDEYKEGFVVKSIDGRDNSVEFLNGIKIFAGDVIGKVSEDQLRRIIGVNTRIPSARNQQVLRFRPVLADEAPGVLAEIRLGGALPELHLPLPGTGPNAFIIVCSTVPEDRYVDIDLGISVQSMLLQAAEIGLNGICIGAFDKERIRQKFHLESEPLLILAIGKGIEKIELVEISENDDHRYFRKDGIHYVPKVRVEDLIIG